MPFLMLQDKNSLSPLKLAIEKKDISLVNNFIDLCLK